MKSVFHNAVIWN